ncbi:DoxX family membrane protein [Mesorhizobium sp. YIM 152430]|nr:DoxX family membrane protein [Mesorhizobium sp. YIM 152430]MDF1601482.1 DoxX family membrane protein [Mesorhizobium sp. YIM 152430]
MARIAFGVFFAGSAILKLGATDTMVAMLSGAGFERPLPFVYLVSAAQMAAGIALIAGRLVWPASFGLIAYVAVVNWYLHPFWVLDGEAASIQFQLFTKNLGIMAGLLAVAGAHHGTRQD